MNAFVASPVQKLPQPGWIGLFLIVPEERSKGLRGSKKLKLGFGEEQHLFPQQKSATPVLQVHVLWRRG